NAVRSMWKSTGLAFRFPMPLWSAMGWTIMKSTVTYPISACSKRVFTRDRAEPQFPKRVQPSVVQPACISPATARCVGGAGDGSCHGRCAWIGWSVLAATILSLGLYGALAVPPARAQENVGSYTVAPGDTLFAIAERFGVTLDDLVALNHIQDPSLIRVG